MGKLVRRHERKIAREREQQNRVDARRFQQAQFFRKRSQKFQVVIGTQNAGWVGLKGDDHRLCVFGLRAPHNLVENHAVSAVHTVEVADADQCGTEVVGNIFEFVKGPHPTSSSHANCGFLASLGMTIRILFRPSNFELDFHPVKRQLHSRGQRGIRSFVGQIVTDVRKESALWFYLFHNFQRLLDG